MITLDLKLLGGFKQNVRAIHIRLDKGIGCEQRSIDVRLGRKVYDRVNISIANRCIHNFSITNIPTHKTVTRLELFADVDQVIQIAGIGQFIENRHVIIGMVLQNIPNVIRSYEAGSASDQ